MQPLPDGISFD